MSVQNEALEGMEPMPPVPDDGDLDEPAVPGDIEPWPDTPDDDPHEPEPTE